MEADAESILDCTGKLIGWAEVDARLAISPELAAATCQILCPGRWNYYPDAAIGPRPALLVACSPFLTGCARIDATTILFS